MGQAATKAAQSEGVVSTASDVSVSVTTPAEVSPQLPAAAAATGSVGGADNDNDGSGSDMAAAAAPSCRVNLRESIAKMRWTASSLESLKSAEERLIVSVALGSSTA